MKSIARISVFVLAGMMLCQVASAQVQATFRPAASSGLEIFFLKDFDINSPASGPPIFFVDLDNSGGSPVNIILSLGLESRRSGVLSSGETAEFQLQPGRLTLSNNNLFSSTDPNRLTRYQIAENVVDELLKDVLATGKLPTDVYTFRVEVRRADNQNQLDNDLLEIRVSNPKKLDLIFPGGPVGSRTDDCPEIFTNLPQFRWESDMQRFQVIVAEARPGDDPESALNQEPRFTNSFAIGSISVGGFDPLPSTSFQYPPDAPLSLRPGKTYYWRVIGIVNTSGGDFPEQSEIYCFRIASVEDAAGQRQQLEFVLRNILGADFDKVLGENGELTGYQATRITLNGKAVALSDLIAQMKEISESYKGYRIE
jgi:hypothetical protein